MFFTEFDMIFSFGKKPSVYLRTFLLAHCRRGAAGEVFHQHAAAGVCDFDGGAEVFYFRTLLGYGITFDDAELIDRIHYFPCFSLRHA